MGWHIGIDVGSLNVRLAAIGEDSDREVHKRIGPLAAWFLASDVYRGPADLQDRLVLSTCRRILREPARAVLDVLAEFCALAPEIAIKGLEITGSGAKDVCEKLDLISLDETQALTTMVTRLYPQVRAVMNIGCASFRYIDLADDSNSEAEIDTNSGECLEGMGAFLEQQAHRLGIAIEDMGARACQGNHAPKISRGCSVFVKTDMIHAQQKGYSHDDILMAVCETAAHKFKNRLVGDKTVPAPTAFIGGVSQNTGVVKAIRELFEWDEHHLFVPELYTWCSAIGAALCSEQANGGLPRPLQEILDAQVHGTAKSEDGQTFPPLRTDSIVQLPYSPEILASAPGNGSYPAYMGIDIGSVSTKLAVLNTDGQLIHSVTLTTAGRPIHAVQQGLAEIERLWGHCLDIRAVGTTGSGRDFIGEFVGADITCDEITAHKTGTAHINDIMGGEPVDTIIEIGGQDSKLIILEDGIVTDFALNDACAAGTGSFLEEQAAMFGIHVETDFTELAFKAANPAYIPEHCTLATGNHVMAKRRNGENMENIMAGLAYAVASNYVKLIIRKRQLGKRIYFQGGTASNLAVAAAFTELLQCTIVIPPHNGVMGAIGAALIARDCCSKDVSSKFRGFHLHDLAYKERHFVCLGCANSCNINEFSVDGRKSYWGNRCIDKYGQPKLSDREPVIEDLLVFRAELFKNIADQGVVNGKYRIGLPQALAMHALYPFWHAYFSALDCSVELSPPTSSAILENSWSVFTSFLCFPARTLAGHVRQLMERSDLDYVLAAAVDSFDATGAWGRCCQFSRILPLALKSAPLFKEKHARILAPTVPFLSGREHVADALAREVAALGVTKRQNKNAVAEAYAAQSRVTLALLSKGADALERLRQTREPGLILLAHPYVLYDTDFNCGIPAKLRHRYGANVIPMDFITAGLPETMQDFPLDMEQGAQMLALTSFTTERDNLYRIQLTTAMCCFDDTIDHILRKAAKKPLLKLQFGGQNLDSGYITRCEAYLSSLGILRATQPKSVKGGAHVA